MANNEKLARWQGINRDCGNCGAAYNRCDCDVVGIGTGSTSADYLTDSAAAMSLLDTLVEKGFMWSMYGKQSACMLKVYTMPDVKYVTANEGATINEAIVSAILELIEKEG